MWRQHLTNDRREPTQLDAGIQTSLHSRGNSKNLIAGRTLWGYANDIVLRNCKKACAIAESRLDSTGNLPSGKREEDFYNHVLEEMYKVLEKSVKPVVKINQEDVDIVVDDEAKDDSSVSNDSFMPEHWFFPGFLSL